ncbi:MAG: GxxExxY protein [Chloroflexi bacterium]|nr:GxxExxY protein [Chloroflexota bacterium]
MAELLCKQEVFAIVGAAMEVYNHLGPGFSEPVYQEVLEIELENRCIPTKPQHEISIIYKDKPIKKYYIADYLCYDKVVVEIKALSNLTLREEGQVLNYLKATGMQVGVLINFGSFPSLEWKRLVFTKTNPHLAPALGLREDSSKYKLEIRED